MGIYLLRCELKGIQDFVLRGRKLKEMAGGSALIKDLLDNEASARDSALVRATEAVGLKRRADLQLDGNALSDALGARDWYPVASAAGGVTLLVGSKEAVAQLVPRIALEVERMAPGVQLVQAWVAKDARWDEPNYSPMVLLMDRLRAARSFRPAALLQPGPTVDTPNNGGSPAVALAEGQAIDAVQRAQRERMKTEFTRIGRELMPDAWADEPYEIPGDTADIAGGRRSGRDLSYVAIIHADGNGVGQIVRQLKNLKEYKEFALALSEATRAAVERATDQALRPERGLDDRGTRWRLPARPVVIGGDDVTVITRADRGLAFVEAFAQAFAHETAQREAITKLNGGQGLTASAGVVFVNHSHPYRGAYHHAEQLCSRAKALGRAHSLPCVAFERVTTSMIEEDQQSTHYQGGTLFTAGNAYVLDTLAEPPVKPAAGRSLKALRGLHEALTGDLPRGPVREIARCLQEDPAGVTPALKRLVEVQRSREQRDRPLLAALDRLGLQIDREALAHPLPAGSNGPTHWTPWIDALALRDAEAASLEALSDPTRFLDPTAMKGGV